MILLRWSMQRVFDALLLAAGLLTLREGMEKVLSWFERCSVRPRQYFCFQDKGIDGPLRYGINLQVLVVAFNTVEP